MSLWTAHSLSSLTHKLGLAQPLSFGQCCCCLSHRKVPGRWFCCTEKVFLLSNFYRCLWRSLVAHSLPPYFSFSFYSVFSIFVKIMIKTL